MPTPPVAPILFSSGSVLAFPGTRLLVRDAIIKVHNIVERQQWGKRTPKYENLEKDWDYDSIVIHHSGNRGYKDPKEIERKHMDDNKYDDVGYHYMIHPNGTIYEGREIIYKGTHVFQVNTGKIGILMMGDYDEQWWDFDDTLSQTHIEKMKELVKTLRRSFTGIKYFGGHLEFAKAHGDERTCPGNLLMAKMDELRNEFGLNAPQKS